MEKPFVQLFKKTLNEKRRLVIPLIGFPGLNITGSTIKLAQQNYGEHFKVLKAIAETYKPDGIFPLMDLSVEANALGRYTIFPEQESATVIRDVFDTENLNSAKEINIAFDTRLLGYIETMKLMKIGLPSNILRGAYVTGPYTLSALLMGADDAAMATVMNTDKLHLICQFMTEKILEYVRLLIASGAQMICILEPSAVMLGPEQFEQFSSLYVHQIIESCRFSCVSTIYHICGNTMHLVKKMAETGVDALSLDSPETGVDLPAVAKIISSDVMIIGNINPVGALLNGTSEDVENDVQNLLKNMEPFSNFVLSTGCDLPQEVPKENICAFMETGRNYKINCGY
ncbi:MAG: uroporphyrinogen decarboxylase family protein [Ignavibacteriaceae bacterium]